MGIQQRHIEVGRVASEGHRRNVQRSWSATCAHKISMFDGSSGSILRTVCISPDALVMAVAASQHATHQTIPEH